MTEIFNQPSVGGTNPAYGAGSAGYQSSANAYQYDFSEFQGYDSASQAPYSFSTESQLHAGESNSRSSEEAPSESSGHGLGTALAVGGGLLAGGVALFAASKNKRVRKKLGLGGLGKKFKFSQGKPKPTVAGKPQPTFGHSSAKPQGAGYAHQGVGSKPQGAGYAHQGAGSKPQGAGYANQGAGSKPQGAGHANQGAGSKPQGAGYANQGAGSKPQGAGYANQGAGPNPQGAGAGHQGAGPKPQGASRFTPEQIKNQKDALDKVGVSHLDPTNLTDAQRQEINKKFRKWSRYNHPDKGGNAELYKQVNGSIDDLIKVKV